MLRSFIKQIVNFGQRIKDAVTSERERYRQSNVTPLRSDQDESMSTAEAGHLGGTQTAKSHGHEFYEKIGRRGGKRSHGPRSSKAKKTTSRGRKAKTQKSSRTTKKAS